MTPPPHLIPEGPHPQMMQAVQHPQIGPLPPPHIFPMYQQYLSMVPAVLSPHSGQTTPLYPPMIRAFPRPHLVQAIPSPQYSPHYPMARPLFHHTPPHVGVPPTGLPPQMRPFQQPARSTHPAHQQISHAPHGPFPGPNTPTAAFNPNFPSYNPLLWRQ